MRALILSVLILMGLSPSYACNCENIPYVQFMISNDDELSGNAWHFISSNLAFDLVIEDEPERCFVQLEFDETVPTEKLKALPIGEFLVYFNGQWVLGSTFEHQLNDGRCFTLMM
jgi:hypothetical protein